MWSVCTSNTYLFSHHVRLPRSFLPSLPIQSYGWLPHPSLVLFLLMDTEVHVNVSSSIFLILRLTYLRQLTDDFYIVDKNEQNCADYVHKSWSVILWKYYFDTNVVWFRVHVDTWGVLWCAQNCIFMINAIIDRMKLSNMSAWNMNIICVRSLYLRSYYFQIKANGTKWKNGLKKVL